MTVAAHTSEDITRETGYVDRYSGRFVAEPRQHLIEASADIDAGLRLLRLAAAPDPDGDPARERGMQHLTAAYERLAVGFPFSMGAAGPDNRVNVAEGRKSRTGRPGS